MHISPVSIAQVQNTSAQRTFTGSAQNNNKRQSADKDNSTRNIILAGTGILATIGIGLALHHTGNLSKIKDKITGFFKKSPENTITPKQEKTFGAIDKEIEELGNINVEDAKGLAEFLEKAESINTETAKEITRLTDTLDEIAKKKGVEAAKNLGEGVSKAGKIEIYSGPIKDIPFDADGIARTAEGVEFARRLENGVINISGKNVRSSLSWTSGEPKMIKIYAKGNGVKKKRTEAAKTLGGEADKLTKSEELIANSQERENLRRKAREFVKMEGERLTNHIDALRKETKTVKIFEDGKQIYAGLNEDIIFKDNAVKTVAGKELTQLGKGLLEIRFKGPKESIEISYVKDRHVKISHTKISHSDSFINFIKL